MDHSNYRVGKTIFDVVRLSTGAEIATLRPTLGDTRVLPDIVDADLSAVNILRFDAVNARDTRCVLCHMDFSQPMVQLALDDLATILGRIPGVLANLDPVGGYSLNGHVMMRNLDRGIDHY